MLYLVGGARHDLEKLEDALRFIRARVHDPEKRHEDESSEVIIEWLRRLRQVLYRADDLFDDVFTISCRKQRTSGSKLAKVRTVFSSSNPVIFNRKMAKEIKSIRKELDDIKSKMDGLNLRVCLTDREPVSRLVLERETISYVKVDSVVGRESDKSKIIDMLFDPKYAEEIVSVIPIVGFGGLGKTTLAQLVFNDERVKKHFNFAKWACVPEVNDHKEVLGKILKALNNMSYNDLSREQIQSEMREAVKEKKFLLVLDDIWDESRDRWLDLISLLQCGNRGSKIVVTTRSDVVASVVGTVPEAYKLGLLTPEESWTLFKLLAFRKGQEESNPTLAQIGKEIVGNCGNVPLAIRVVGSLLYSKHTEKEWELFRDAQLSKAKLIDLSNIMPVLKLSYDYLPSALKQCFAYCSLFPKDYRFRNTELVRLWMAQGYVEPVEESLGMEEDVADQYFLELLRRNFFQDVMKYGTDDIILCKMHDLVHDLAQHVAGGESIVVEGTRAQFTNRLVHANIYNRVMLDEVPQSLLVASNLRSLLLSRCCTSALTIKELILKFGSLRALESDTIEIVPESIGRLRHLRHLNLSGSPIKFLPSGITRLDNLITLDLNYCRKLKELPRGLIELTNLRHLGILYCPFIDLPLDFGKMKSLRELNRFIIGSNNGLDALADLNIRGTLGIEYRKCRTNAVLEARIANFKEKKQLSSVSFCFEYQGEQTTVATREEELLSSLQLPPNLEYLRFSGLIGRSFPPRMLNDLPKLVKINIQQCDSCQVLPLFSRLPLLRDLTLIELRALEYVEADDFRECSSAVYFPALESLELVSMGELKRWSKVEHDDSVNLGPCYLFPRLRSLRFYRCRKLMRLPAMPQLESLMAYHIHGELLTSILASSSPTPTLKSLTMGSIELISLRNISDGMHCLSALETLSINNCEDFDAWDVSRPGKRVIRVGSGSGQFGSGQIRV
ncbi:hypothetical protein RND81_09G050900 [Saponaria officinalis]|uniref:Disease resistance protein RGA3 n=1 Tax=Saponaria officinalis TaxID=3572 RepID=A0AAW1IGU1_SAPOF